MSLASRPVPGRIELKDLRRLLLAMARDSFHDRLRSKSGLYYEVIRWRMRSKGDSEGRLEPLVEKMVEGWDSLNLITFMQDNMSDERWLRRNE